MIGRLVGFEIRFALEGRSLYMLSGARDHSGWVRNLRETPEVTVRIAGERFEGRARVVGEESGEDDLARRSLVEKYERTLGSLSNWRRIALPVAVDLAV